MIMNEKELKDLCLKQEEAINKAVEILNNPWSLESGNKKVDDITYKKKREVINILRGVKSE